MLTGTPPFYSPNRDQMFKNIISSPLVLKPYFSPEASSLLQMLLQTNVISMQPHQRLCSVEEAKKHPFFHGIDWVKLARKEVKPPFRPSTGEGSDVRNFDPVPDHRLAESPVAVMTSQEKEALVFDQFTYNEAAALK